MEKTRRDKQRDAEKRGGKVWVKDPQMNLVQVSGVEFRGRYLTRDEYRKYLSQRLKAILGGNSDD